MAKSETERQKLLRAFVGLSNPEFRSIKGTPHKIIFDFGEIKIPRSAITMDIDRRRQELEERYDCVIKELSWSYISILPKKVMEFQMLCSASENHRKALAEWFMRSGAKLIRVLLKR